MKTIFKTEEITKRTQVLRMHTFDSLEADHIQLIKVNKPQAEELYDNGYTVFFHPCRMRLNNMWQSPYEAQRNKQRPEEFQTVNNEFIYYNCDNERGVYPSYFAILNYQGNNKYQIIKTL